MEFYEFVYILKNWEIIMYWKGIFDVSICCKTEIYSFISSLILLYEYFSIYI